LVILDGGCGAFAAASENNVNEYRELPTDRFILLMAPEQQKCASRSE
jgi:hypothetical protein